AGSTAPRAADGTWHPARGGHQAASGKALPQPAGPRGGAAGLGDGALRGRLRRAVPHERRSRDCAGVSARMDGGGRAEPAPNQDAHRQRGARRLRVSGLALSRREEVAAQEESSETAGENATADAAHQRTKPERDHCEGQSHPAGLVRLLPAKPSYGPEWSGRLAAATPAGDAAQTGETARLRAERGRQPTVAQPVVCGARVV